eukprot:4905582-Alexandrium_andersonii.AAC.1
MPGEDPGNPLPCLSGNVPESRDHSKGAEAQHLEQHLESLGDGFLQVGRAVLGLSSDKRGMTPNTQTLELGTAEFCET